MYADLTRAQLEQRLRVAEDLCIAYGWTPLCGRSDIEEATHELWTRWAHHVPKDFTGPAAHPELNGSIGALAAHRRATREATLARLHQLGT